MQHCWLPRLLAAADPHPGAPAAAPHCLQFAQGAAAGSYTVTDATGAVANVVGEPVTACGSTVFVIDQVGAGMGWEELGRAGNSPAAMVVLRQSLPCGALPHACTAICPAAQLHSALPIRFPPARPESRC